METLFDVICWKVGLSLGAWAAARNCTKRQAVITFQLQNYHMQALSLLLLLTPTLALTSDSPCPCLNSGTCSPPLTRCLCPPSHIGDSCQLPATPITPSTLSASLSTNYSYFYFQPDQINYYKLVFNICMLDNPAQRDTLFYIETERADGTLRTVPSMFETAKLVLDARNCANFATHYISVKRREDDSYRRIVMGLKILGEGDEDKYLNVYPETQSSNKSQEGRVSSPPSMGKIQKISLTMTYEVYIQTSYYGTAIILFTSFVLLLILTSLVTYLRRKYSLTDPHFIPTHAARLHQLQRDSELPFRIHPFRINPEEHYRPRRNSLSHLDIFMPATRYGVTDSVFLPHLLINEETEMSGRSEGDVCPICLLEFQPDDPIRTTPCRHRYHRECIDNWCEAKMSCPICRRELDFSQEIRRIYYAFLRNQLRA